VRGARGPVGEGPPARLFMLEDAPLLPDTFTFPGA